MLAFRCQGDGTGGPNRPHLGEEPITKTGSWLTRCIIRWLGLYMALNHTYNLLKDWPEG